MPLSDLVEDSNPPNDSIQMVNGVGKITTKQHNTIVKLLQGTDSDKIPQAAIENLVSDLASKASSTSPTFIDDVGQTYKYGGSAWRTRKQIYLVPNPAAASNVTGNIGPTITVEGSWTNTLDADGACRTWPTGAVNNNDAGYFTSAVCLRRSFDFDITFKFKPVSSTVLRIWIGVVESDHMASDTDAAIHKFALRLSTAAANVNYCIVHSDGTTEGTPVQVAVADSGTAHTIRLVADNANSRFGYSFDGAAVAYISTNIPGANDDLRIQCQIRTMEAVSKDMCYYWMEGWSDL
jgi:hypothetical protein